MVSNALRRQLPISVRISRAIAITMITLMASRLALAVLEDSSETDKSVTSRLTLADSENSSESMTSDFTLAVLGDTTTTPLKSTDDPNTFDYICNDTDPPMMNTNYRRYIVDLMNEMRSKTALNVAPVVKIQNPEAQIKNPTSAANMNKIRYNCHLEAIMQEHVENCSENNARYNFQQTLLILIADKKDINNTIRAATFLWSTAMYEDLLVTQYAGITQMGCGISFNCSLGGHIFCAYSPNFDQDTVQLYEYGTPGSKCSYGSEGNLCLVPKDQALTAEDVAKQGNYNAPSEDSLSKSHSPPSSDFNVVFWTVCLILGVILFDD